MEGFAAENIVSFGPLSGAPPNTIAKCASYPLPGGAYNEMSTTKPGLNPLFWPKLSWSVDCDEGEKSAWPTAQQTKPGANWIRPGRLKCKWRAVVGQQATLKADQKIICRGKPRPGCLAKGSPG